MAIVQASSVSLSFDVDPTEFEVGDTVSLRVRAINPLTLQPLDNVPIEFWQDGYGYGTLVGGQCYYADGNGVATANWVYPTNGVAHTIVAKVADGQPVANVTLSMQPITLTVGVETQLWLTIERSSTSTNHTIIARLIKARDSTPLSNQSIKLEVNDAVYTLTTNGTGHVKQALKLEAVGGQATTYQVKATFDGANPQTRNLTVADQLGQNYVVCTTMQYGYKPSSNSASLTVEPPKTDAKTPKGKGSNRKVKLNNARFFTHNNMKIHTKQTTNTNPTVRMTPQKYSPSTQTPTAPKRSYYQQFYGEVNNT